MQHFFFFGQSGLRKDRSTDDQTTFLAYEIEDAFQIKSKLLATFLVSFFFFFFDLTKTFDQVWKAY